MWIPEQDFRRRHADWHRSAEAKAMKRRLLARQGGRCARCREPLPRWGGVLNLTSYEGMKAGHVNDADANLLHRGCHPKGTYSWERLRSDREADRFIRAFHRWFSRSWRAIRWITRLALRAGRWFLRRLWRALRWLAGRPSAPAPPR